jgi:hypothetical protein
VKAAVEGRLPRASALPYMVQLRAGRVFDPGGEGLVRSHLAGQLASSGGQLLLQYLYRVFWKLERIFLLVLFIADLTHQWLRAS